MAPAIQIECPAAAIQSGPWGDENWPDQLFEPTAAEWICLSRQGGKLEILFTDSDRALGFVRLGLDDALTLWELLSKFVPTLE